jgi:multiple sugar transport system ATP-binding protein
MIKIQGVSKRYDSGFEAVRNVDLTVEDGEFMVLVGPSGCGKTTLLRMIAGLEEVTEGTIWMDEREVTHTPPQQRDIAMVFQNYALYPHMSVAENLGYSMRVRGSDKHVMKERIAKVATLLGLEALLQRRPNELSGGQRQRVAIGRAIIREPKAFLMDEPLSNLDAKLRVGMRAELARLHRHLQVTTVYVTHDQVEAMTLGHRVAVLRDGEITQVGPPDELYRKPRNMFVAAFIGAPTMNMVEAVISGSEIVFAGIRLPVARSDRQPVLPQGRVVLGIRPEAFEAAQFAPPEFPTMEVTADLVEAQGADAYVGFTLDAPRVDTDQLRKAADGDEAELMADKRTHFMARTNPRAQLTAGQVVRLALDTAQFHYFDPASGNALPVIPGDPA